jgi:hypothetical protein
MSKFNIFSLAIVAIVSATIMSASAQTRVGAPTGPANAPSGAPPIAPSTSTQGDQAQKFGTVVSQPEKQTSKSKNSAPTQAEILRSTQMLANSLNLSCVVSDAALVAKGSAASNGQAAATATYEAACGNGMGYFLISRDPGKPYGISCLAAYATDAADRAQGKPADTVCTLPNNADVKAMATTVLSRAGTVCAVRDLKLVGVSTKTNTEYTEIVCNDGAGYVLGVPVPGTGGVLHVETCRNSQIACKLSNANPAASVTSTVTKQSLKDALAQNNVSCDASGMHVVGQEKVLQRYVVEFQCPQQPKGLVAFIPMNGNTAKFEMLDCAAAAKRGVECTLTPVK